MDIFLCFGIKKQFPPMEVIIMGGKHVGNEDLQLSRAITLPQKGKFIPDTECRY
jgi:hypothetical protein